MEAFRQVLKEIPRTVLLIVGGGERFEQLRDYAQVLGIGSVTIFCGRVPASQVNKYYHISDVSVNRVYDTPGTRSRFPLNFSKVGSPGPLSSQRMWVTAADYLRTLSQDCSASQVMPYHYPEIFSKFLIILR